ncbi:hypothetical protein Curi_c22040 [Gottschalkia acidurici 9a]|uniref:Lipoprotein n=1 Tax=Gottschalkia acidurici (strain ATCC 7906 / DSM 604 / BCRC 14475 / CIP 104303 / KCTC 5404 / NCIMB 10678 / 9a) TaxID=1128398 RepID=K0B263_GOTA9|nr:hypothetical protein [Gottschalkia acidurici]AFS79207.1 hypothetical protein Curi_c22040 [Gottschalkia acidurici 9a]
MKKVILFLSLSLVMTLMGCNSNKDTGNLNSSVIQKSEDEKMHVEQEEKEIEEPKVTVIEKGQTITVDDFCEFVINDIKFGKTINPPNPASFYTYYEAKEPNTTYLDTVINIKSLLTSGRSADEFMSVEVIYNDKYKYSTFSTIEEDNGGSFTYTNITSIEPLKNGTLHFLAEVPDEVEQSNGKLALKINVNNQEYQCNIR